MYELRCPSCGHTVTSSFVRPGAIVNCSDCAHTYRIREAHIRRTVEREDQPRADVQTDPLLAGAPEPRHARTGERLDTDAQGNVIGLSGLSEMMRRESGTARSQRAVASPPLASLRERRFVRRLDRWGVLRSPKLLLAIGGIGLMLVAAGCLVLILVIAGG